ncbi:MAG: DMT family transporter [Acidimicrobiales bacterium]|nr:DMT family transporter [Acidimicrobiales bacterium]
MLLGLGVPMWNYAHRFVPVAEVNLLLVTEVVLAPVWLWIWPGERPSTTTLIGGGIALAAVTWLTVVTARAGEMERAPRRVGLHVGSAPGYRRFVRRTNGDR